MIFLHLYSFQEFNKKSNSLYTILRSSRLAESQRAPYLRRFLMRLNFNFFFEVKTLLIDGDVITSQFHFCAFYLFTYFTVDCKRSIEHSQATSNFAYFLVSLYFSVWSFSFLICERIFR